ncbi:hypothetical protein BC828DRAFT_372308 [Blastocladiella britannica]|nr:hypothetical protein BC828DRAFT_372308 [Blastocladiella britannica]
MAKKSAISKAYKRKPAATAAAAAGNGANPKARKPMSRKEREYMAEFGTLDIDGARDASDDEDRAEIAMRISAKRAFTEDDLDRSIAQERARTARLVDSGASTSSAAANPNDLFSDDDDDKLSSFDTLMSTMATGKQKSVSALKRSLLDAFKKPASGPSTAPALRSSSAPLSSSSDDEDDGADEELSLSTDEEDAEHGLDDDEEIEIRYNKHGDLSDDDDKMATDDYPNHYDTHFADAEPTVNHVRKLAGLVSAGDATWQAVPLTDHVTFQLPIVPSDPLTTTVRDTHVADMQQEHDVRAMHVKSRILAAFLASNPLQSPFFNEAFGKLDRYHDVLWTSPDFAQHVGRLRRAIALHVLNHVYKSRDRVLRGNARIREAQQAAIAASSRAPVTRAAVDLDDEEGMRRLAEATGSGGTSNTTRKDKRVAPLSKAPRIDVESRDQGFTRPKVLILTPMRNTAYDLVKLLMDYSGTDQQANKRRFRDEYYTEDDGDSSFAARPADYRATFRGNTDDCFKIGLGFSRKAMKLYSQFYSSDVIVASPLGLRMMVETERDSDFLSSIEMVVVDSAHVMNMQNWDHLSFAMDLLNRIPKKSHDCDFSRVKSWYLDDLAKNYRQTIVLSEYAFPDLLALFNQHSQNVQRPRIRYRYPVKNGSIVSLTTGAPQTFVKVDGSVEQAEEARFQHLTTKILPKFRRPRRVLPGGHDLDTKHLLLFVPSYFDYVRLRNHMDEAEYDFEVVTEYTEAKEKTRARTLFFQGRTRILVYTERAHYFHRSSVRGALHVVFYGLPDNAVAYSEVTNFLGLPRSQALAAACRAAGSEVSEGNVTVLYSKWDALKLERVVGPSRVAKLLQGAGPFVFRS